MWQGLKIGVVIVAGGSGSRMGADVPKQFLHLHNESILAHTVRRFLPYADRIVVVLPADQFDLWHKEAERSNLSGCCEICAGGATRFHSVREGLERVGECDFVMVHDGVRPLLSPEMIERGLECALRGGSAIPTVGAVDSFRIVEGETLRVVDRTKLRAIQTPQIFDYKTLVRAYQSEPSERFTDDATVVEALGVELCYYEGERRNLKITTPDDLLMAEIIITHKGR